MKGKFIVSMKVLVDIIYINDMFVVRKHKKGQVEEVAKKKTRKTQKFQKAVAGATINEIMAKRNQKPEVRKAQREQAIRWVT